MAWSWRATTISKVNLKTMVKNVVCGGSVGAKSFVLPFFGEWPVLNLHCSEHFLRDQGCVVQVTKGISSRDTEEVRSSFLVSPTTLIIYVMKTHNNSTCCRRRPNLGMHPRHRRNVTPRNSKKDFGFSGDHGLISSRLARAFCDVIHDATWFRNADVLVGEAPLFGSACMQS